MSSGFFKCLGGLTDDRVDFASDIAFEATDDFDLAHSLCGSSTQVRLRPQVVAQSDDDYAIPEYLDDAGTGLTPHSDAKAASELRRSGLLPAAISRAAAVSGSYSKRFDQCWCRSLDEPFELGLQVLDFLAELTVTTGKRTECVLGCCRGIGPDDQGGSFCIA